MKKILSIDGGGIRGIIPAMVLAEIEKRIQKPISSLFDLIVGTSAGGILGLGLCMTKNGSHPYYSAEDFVELYSKRGGEIFFRSFWQRVKSIWGVVDEKYSSESLEKILKEYFEEEILGKSLKPILIGSYDLENRRPFFFKSWEEETKKIKMRDVARATSAAPAYFEPARIEVENNKMLTLIDGGVFINNPAMSAYAEAKKIFPDENSFLILSLGTGKQVRPILYDSAKNWGLAEWALPIMDIMFDGVSDAVNYQLNYICTDNFYRIQTRLDIANDDLDDASKKNITLLKKEASLTILRKGEELTELCEKLIS